MWEEDDKEDEDEDDDDSDEEEDEDEDEDDEDDEDDAAAGGDDSEDNGSDEEDDDDDSGGGGDDEEEGSDDADDADSPEDGDTGDGDGDDGNNDKEDDAAPFDGDSDGGSADSGIGADDDNDRSELEEEEWGTVSTPLSFLASAKDSASPLSRRPEAGEEEGVASHEEMKEVVSAEQTVMEAGGDAGQASEEILRRTSAGPTCCACPSRDNDEFSEWLGERKTGDAEESGEQADGFESRSVSGDLHLLVVSLALIVSDVSDVESSSSCDDDVLIAHCEDNSNHRSQSHQTIIIRISTINAATVESLISSK